MFLVAVLFTVLGIAIYKGKTDLIHDYHQTKVTNKSAYGKAFGKAMLVIAAVMLLSGISYTYNRFGGWYRLHCCGAKKYNKGVF